MKDNASAVTGDSHDEQLIKEISEELKQNEENQSDENPDWDGSEAELVADDDAEEYEIPETGIKLSYALTRDEMYRCLRHSRLYKTKGARAVFQTVVFALASVAFFFAYFFAKNDFSGYNLFFGIFCLVMIVVIWLVPYLHIKSLSKIMADGKIIEVEVYPDHLDIGRDDGAWSIELDGSAEIAEFDNIFMLYTPKGQSFAIPGRVIEPELYNEIRAILFSGALPEKQDRRSSGDDL